MTAWVTSGAGFLLAVLWFDLMFDVQVRRHRDGDLPPEVLSSIAGYYRRVTTAARPMNRLVALAMLGTIVAIAIQLGRGDDPTWLGIVSLGLVGVPVVLAAVRTVPAAVRLGGATDTAADQSRLARAIWRDHLVCLTGIAALLVVQLAYGR